MFVFVCFSLLLRFLSLFSLVYISGQNFISNSKDAAGTTAVVELTIRTITVSFLLTLAIIHYSRELSVQEIFIEHLSNGNGSVWK